jgi:hypothetical protein
VGGVGTLSPTSFPIYVTGAASASHGGVLGHPVINQRIPLLGAMIQSHTTALLSDILVFLSGAVSFELFSTDDPTDISTSAGSLGLRLSTTGFAMTDLEVVIDLPPSEDEVVSLAWSDNKGATYQHPIERTLGNTGEYLTSITWRRLGMGRDRVFVVEWSAPSLTALTGAFVETAESQS